MKIGFFYFLPQVGENIRQFFRIYFLSNKCFNEFKKKKHGGKFKMNTLKIKYLILKLKVMENITTTLYNLTQASESRLVRNIYIKSCRYCISLLTEVSEVI